MFHIAGGEAHEAQIQAMGNVPAEAENDRRQGKVNQRESFAHGECVVRFEIGVKISLHKE
jgi:hypothetical protein